MKSDQTPPAPSAFHPLDHPNFAPSGVVWYLSHPLAADERFTLDQNMRDVERWLRLCLEEGFKTIAPYHTHILVLDDNNPAHRKIGLETDCIVVKSVRHMILTGHKLSRGMEEEKKYASTMIDLIGLSEEDARKKLRDWRTP